MRRSRKPYRAKGAIVINPRRKAPRRASAKRKNPRKQVKNVRSVTVRYGGPKKRRTTKRKNPLRVRRGMGTLRVRRNPSRQMTITEVKKRNPRKRRKAPKVMRTRKNPSTKRRTARRRKNPGYMKKLEKVPLVGPFLAASAAMLAPTAVGAVSVEPNRMVNRGIAAIYPDLPASASHAIAGVVLGGITLLVAPRLGASKQTSQLLATSMAAAGGALGYHYLTAEPDATTEDAMGTLIARGVPVGNPVLGLGQTAAGLAGIGTLHGSSYPALGNATAVYPGAVPAGGQDIGVAITSQGSGIVR